MVIYLPNYKVIYLLITKSKCVLLYAHVKPDAYRHASEGVSRADFH